MEAESDKKKQIHVPQSFVRTGSAVESPAGGKCSISAISNEHDEDLHRWCKSMGMLPEAVLGWESICRQSKQCCILYIVAAVAYSPVFGVVYIGGLPWPNRRGIILQLLMTIVTAIQTCSIYRRGPAFARKKSCLLMTCLVVVCLASQVAFSQAGSDQDAPFNNRTLTLLIGGLGAWFLYLAGLCGSVAAAHPDRPHASILTPIKEATIITLKVLSTLSDVGVVRALLQRAQQNCYWYGMPVSCMRYKAMAAVLAAFACVEMVKITVFIFIHRLLKQETMQARRLNIGGGVLTLTSEIGIVTVTLLKLFSDTRTAAAGSDAYTTSDNFHADVTFTILSLVFSIATFCVSAVGVRKVLTATTSLARRVTGRASNARPASVRPTQKGVFPEQLAAVHADLEAAAVAGGTPVEVEGLAGGDDVSQMGLACMQPSPPARSR